MITHERIEFAGAVTLLIGLVGYYGFGNEVLGTVGGIGLAVAVLSFSVHAFRVPSENGEKDDG